MRDVRFGVPTGRFFWRPCIFWPMGIARIPLTGGSHARSDPRNRRGRALAREQVHQQHLPAVAADDIGADDLIRAIVGSLDQDVRPD